MLHTTVGAPAVVIRGHRKRAWAMLATRLLLVAGLAEAAGFGFCVSHLGGGGPTSSSRSSR